jgi:uncharacterized protein YegL
MNNNTNNNPTLKNTDMMLNYLNNVNQNNQNNLNISNINPPQDIHSQQLNQINNSQVQINNINPFDNNFGNSFNINQPCVNYNNNGFNTSSVNNLNTNNSNNNAFNNNPFFNNNINNNLYVDYGLLQAYNNNNLYNDDEAIDNNFFGFIDIISDNQKDDLNNLINVQMKLGKKHLHENSNSQVLPLLLDIDVKEAKMNVKSNIDLICLLDKSGSMEGEKIKLLIDSFKNIIEYLGDNDRLCLITFDSYANRILPLTRMTSEGKSKVLRTVQNITASGGTNIGEAVNLALKVINDRKQANKVTSFLILSDGQDSKAEKTVKNYIDSHEGKVKSNYTINTFGYGQDHDPKMMSALARLRDGAFYFIDKLNRVDEVFVDCLGGLISVVAQNVNIEIVPNFNDEILPGIRFVKAYGVEDFWKKQDEEYNAQLLQVITGKKYSYILEVFIPKLQNLNTAVRSFLVAEAVVKYNDFKGEQYIKKCECDITFIEDSFELFNDKEVLIHYYRVKTSETTSEALKLSNSGLYDKAKELLTNFKNEMNCSAVAFEPMVIGFIKDIEQAINNVKPEVFNNQGMHFMMENAMCNMAMKSNLNANVNYQNNCQQVMLFDLQEKKANNNFI